MAIFGVGSKFGGDTEMKDDFFSNENFVIGWNYASAKDLYGAVSMLKTGDIIYLKANAPGSASIRIKGIGVVTKSFIHCLIEDGLTGADITDWEGLYIKVKWIIKDEFVITIPASEGKLTAIRASTFYEEYLPYVHDEIMNRIFA